MLEKKYLVRVRRIVEEDVIVEVDATFDQWGVAEKKAASMSASKEGKLTIDAQVIRQVGEPWVYASFNCESRWPKEVIVFTRASGNVFTKPETELLLHRIKERIGPIEDFWNGAPSDSFSVRLSNISDADKLTKEMNRELCLPRPKEIDCP